jgi:DNA-binding MarR family transcriptional regulator
MTGTGKRLQREIQQSRPFRSDGHETVIALMRTADLVRRHFSKVLEPRGITGQQYNVLRILRGAGADGLPTLAIADRMVEQTPGITRLLDRMEAKELVSRERCREDRRQMLCYATAAGLNLLRDLDAQVDATEESVVAGLSDRQRAQLLRALEQVRSDVT